ncbi:MAG: NADH-quinone oxidoreductase subunit M [candidate division KSB1 bacterium]|nr:NADH-quinone oxidoreductase subunit M [candidate division KSB1 bacterium]MDZ7274892.1 NADH-quinone oxidoreductase subunit M [candidate division KSB1 bacterium]MDZ7286656.1 NADH-quinone oxidoreductase subunit M [candidate division KSB1 bacterium]MDZ7299181.1 NADH-quinone oxidoreductase subunit M [candidate division KSB1 bacterium]MDZ7307009.1 NADH-quinone oxidoreductase subunit M [candidate division KSB1 bacterium]
MIPNILSWMIFLPVIGAAVVLAIPRGEKQHDLIRWLAAGFTGVQVLLAILLVLGFDRTTSGMQFVEKAPWITSYNIWYFVGVDGLSISMVLLTALLSFLCIFASWGIDKAVKGYFTMFLLLDAGMMGVFCALDFFLFYIFWEVMLLPMYFLIGIWGGPRREYAAIKFFLYTLAGSVLMLVAMLVFYFNVKDPVTGGHTFNMLHMMDQANHTGLLRDFDVRLLLYAALFIGFAIKVPAVPFHTWLPDAHVEAPTAISVILAGVLLKMGTYGMLRISFPILPDAVKYPPFAYGFATIAVISIVYGALCAMSQKDLKKLVAYSSIGHMGVVMLGMIGLTPLGVNGAVLQMFNHGTVTAMLFLLVGVIYDRAHHRDIDGFGGLAQTMPVYTGIVTIAFFANLGLPGLSSFISEAFSFLGAFSSTTFNLRVYTIISVLGIVFVAGYMLWTLQRMFLGKLNPQYADLPEINRRELFTLVPLAVIVIFLGVYPAPMLELLEVSLNSLAATVREAAPMLMGMN